jgi:N-acetylglucosaminyl-diphospho-decaprenol L-rhamnosyltransferase
MDLSIIIVSYNVKYFLEQCLCSVFRASASLNVEVLVVDNNSSDHSIDYLQPRFPSAIFIRNKENNGFAKANNQALEKAKAKYILFLNPDTILPEDCLHLSIAHLNAVPNAGALGIRMVDGAGVYLKESKRGLPTPWVSFCKMSGLTALFPSSSFFAGYYLGHLPSSKNQEVDALSGAFFLTKKDVLDKTGGFDERFFMYAEDIDLSYRIQQAGFVNLYFSECTIIHFKGESTIKNTKYVNRFYKAMSQFVEKHYTGTASRILANVLKAGIRLKELTSKKTRKPAGKLKQPRATHFSVRGDQQSIDQVKSFITINELSENLLYCIGPGYSYKQAIAELQKKNKMENFYIHAFRSGSIVGSISSEMQGQSIEL